VGHKKERKSEREPDPILKLRQARLKALKVMEQEEAHTTADGKVYAPKVGINWEILDDKKKGEHNGVRFWDNYSFVKSFDDENEYVIREGTRIGDLAAFMAHTYQDGADYFEDDVDVVFEDLEGEEVIASLEPRRFQPGEPPTGTRTVSTTLMLAEGTEKVGAKVATEESEIDEEDEDFDDIPF
jgi:hypothetical protein